MKIIRFVILASCFFAAHAVALGGIRPSFLPQESAWRATDVVLVTEGKEIDGVVEVIETLKGDLKPGVTLTLPDLAEFKTKEARLRSELAYPHADRRSSQKADRRRHQRTVSLERRCRDRRPV